jgi:hypothetical protein
MGLMRHLSVVSVRRSARGDLNLIVIGDEETGDTAGDCSRRCTRKLGDQGLES